MINAKLEGAKELRRALESVEDGLDSIPKEKSEDIVQDSQFKDGNNMIQENVLSETNREAKHEARYLSARKQKGFDESQTTDDELAESADEIVTRFIRDYIKNEFS